MCSLGHVWLQDLVFRARLERDGVKGEALYSSGYTACVTWMADSGKHKAWAWVQRGWMASDNITCVLHTSELREYSHLCFFL